MPKPFGRKFVSPAFSGELVSEGNGGFKEKSQKKGKAMPNSLTDSQYEEIFSQVIKKTVCKSKGSYVGDESAEEDNVVIPEPNAALSPDEEAEETNFDVVSNGSATLTKTPKNPIDNSILPPLKKKKPESRIKKLGLKLKPTRLNFDDPELKGNPENVFKPLENDTFPKRNSKKHKMPKITSNSGNVENNMPLPDKEISKSDPSKNKGGNEGSFVKQFVSPKFQSQRTATGKEVGQRKISPCDRIIPSSNLSSVSNVGSLSLSQSTPKSFQFGSQESCSPESKILSPRSRLFRLQKKRNVGLWVQCNNHVCSKWRYLANTCDPTEVPDKWQCYMNDDVKHASCSAEEHGPTPLEEEDLIHNIYTAGSLVWARVAGYPWWPAMVDDDPDVEQYYWITEYCDIPTHYNVSFFDEKPVTRAWLTPGALTKYIPNEKRKDLLKMTANGIDYSHRIKVAMEQANEAAKLPIAERLKKFSFAVRYQGPIGKKRRLEDSPEKNKGGKAKKSKKGKKGEMPDSLGDSQASILKSLEVVSEVNKVLSQIASDSESMGKKGEMPDSLGDSQASILKSLEVVSEVNKVLSQIASDSESMGSEIASLIDVNKSIDEVNEINEVLSILSDCESLGLDDDELEEYLKSVKKNPSTVQRSKEKFDSKSKKKHSADKRRDKHKENKEKKNSVKDSEKRKHEFGHSSSLKEPKSDNKGSGFMDYKKAERNEKSKDRSHKSKDKREKMHSSKDSMKEISDKVQSSSPNESQQNSKRSDTSKSEGDEKHKESSKKGHEVQKEHGKKNSERENIKEKHSSKQGTSDVSPKKVHSDLKKETRTKENKGHPGRTDVINKGKETHKGGNADHHGKLKKATEKDRTKLTKKAEGKTKTETKDMNKYDGSKEGEVSSSCAPKGKTRMETKDVSKHDEGSKGGKPSKAHAARKGSPSSSGGQQSSDYEEKNSGKKRNITDNCQDQESSAEEQEEERLKEGTLEKTVYLEEEDSIEEEEEKTEEGEEVEEESTKEEGGKGSKDEQSGGRAAVDKEQDQEGGCSSTSAISDGRASVDIFKGENEEDAASATSEKSADFDFEE